MFMWTESHDDFLDGLHFDSGALSKLTKGDFSSLFGGCRVGNWSRWTKKAVGFVDEFMVYCCVGVRYGGLRFFDIFCQGLARGTGECLTCLDSGSFWSERIIFRRSFSVDLSVLRCTCKLLLSIRRLRGSLGENAEHYRGGLAAG